MLAFIMHKNVHVLNIFSFKKLYEKIFVNINSYKERISTESPIKSKFCTLYVLKFYNEYNYILK